MELKIYGIYRHFKGNYYLVEGIAQHSETGEQLVIYRPLYGDSSTLYARPLEMFLETVVGKDQKHRFELVKNSSMKPNE